MMKKLAFLLVAFTAAAAHGQVSYPYILNPLTVGPSGACAGPQIQVLDSNGHVYTCNAGTWADITAAGSGTVTSVGLTLNADFTVTGTPVTTSGVLAADWATPPTGTGAMVRKTSAALVTPDLGVPSALAITNATGTCSACVSNSATLDAPIASPTFTGSPKAPGFFPQTVTAGPSINIFEQFLYAVANVIAATNIGSPSGASCAYATALSDSNHPAYLSLVSGTGGAGTGQGCRMGNNAGVIFNPNQTPGWIFETDVQPSVLPGTTAASYSTGIATNPNAYPWTTGVGFDLSSTLGVANDWYCHYASTTIDSTIPATLAWHRLSVVSDGVNVHWYIDGTERCGTGVAIASMPSGAMYLGMTSVAQSGTSVTFNAGYFIFQRNVTR